MWLMLHSEILLVFLKQYHYGLVCSCTCIQFIIVSLATFNVQQTTLFTNNSASICVQCTFADNSPAKGCHVNVIAVSNNATTSIDITTRDNNTRIEGCLSDISSGVYNITIYDIKSDGSISATPVTVYHNITVTAESSASDVYVATCTCASSTS